MATLKVEIYLNSAWVDVSSLTIQTHIDRPFDRVNDVFLTGSCSFTFQDTTGNWNPQNASGTYSAYELPMVPVRITATHSAVSYPLFHGYVKSWSYQPANGAQVAQMQVTALDALAVLAQATVTTLVSDTGETLAGNRVLGALNTLFNSVASGGVGSFYINNLVYYGNTTVQADPGTLRTVLAIIQNMENSELGAFYSTADGTLLFLSRDQIYQRSAGTLTNFYDNGTDITYQDVAFKYDTDFIYNWINVQPPGYGINPAYSPASISSYGQRALNRTQVSNTYFSDIVNQELTLLYGRYNPILRTQYISLDISPGQSATRILAGLSLDFYSPISVNRTAPGGSTITTNLIVCAITFDITPAKWTVKFGTIEPDLYGFVLDVTHAKPGGGILDTNQLTY
jgi:hypothetical protein